MLDPALRGFVDATSEEDAERCLEILLEQRVRPLLGRIVARKLSGHGQKRLFQPEDLDDVVADATLFLLKRLQALRTHGGTGEIESLDDYTAAVAYSTCAHRLRRQYPERARLKSRLHYVLAHDRTLSLWQTVDRGLCCGLSQWRGAQPDDAAAGRVAQFEQTPSQWPNSWKRPSSVDRADPAPVVREIFERVGGAVEFDRLVGLVAAIWQIDRLSHVAADTMVDRLPDTQSSPEVSLDRRRSIERLWVEIAQLPIRQRLALLLNLRDSHGAGLLWIFPVTGVASMRAIARVLEMSIEELGGLWNRLPIDDATLSSQLGCTRQQVINLRMSARKRLGNRLGTLDPASTARSANRPGLSSSLGSET